MQAVVYGTKLNLLNFSSRAGKASIILFLVLNYTIFLRLNHLIPKVVSSNERVGENLIMKL
jgi:hypothetical protein